MGRRSPHVIAFPLLLGCNPSILLFWGKLKTKERCALLKVMQLAKAELGLVSSGLTGSKAEAVSQSFVSGEIQERRLGTVGRHQVSLPYSWAHTNLFSQCILFIETTGTNVGEIPVCCIGD